MEAYCVMHQHSMFYTVNIGKAICWQKRYSSSFNLPARKNASGEIPPRKNASA